MSDLTINDELLELEPLADIMAHEQCRAWLIEDGRQEAMIAAWRALAAGKAPGLVRADMRRAVINVDRGRSLTGNRRAPGRNGVDTHFRYGGTGLVQIHPNGEEYLIAEPTTWSAEDEALAWLEVEGRLVA